MGGAVPFVVDLADAPSTEVGGGKAASLGALVQRGLPVPGGFVLTAAAHRMHMRHIDRADVEFVDGPLEDALGSGRAIRSRVLRSTLTDDLRSAVLDAWRALGGGPVAVRSSATAEDSPDLSFAGQLESVLDVAEPDALERAILTCWASLFTDRAIAYRHRVGSGEGDLTMGVIIQRMVPATAAGVLFTADPLSGRRTEMVIEAVAGLGEALVGGSREPDRYRIGPGSGRVRREGDRHRPPVLDARSIEELRDLGQRAVEVRGSHQDIEWAIEDRRLWVLQSRPITTLFPLPDGLPQDPLHVLISYASQQGVTKPITPLGRDAIRAVQSGAAVAFGYGKGGRQPVSMAEAGERLWFDVTAMVRSRFARRALSGLLGTLEPSARQTLLELRSDRRLAVTQGFSTTSAWRAVPSLVPMLGRFALTAAQPDRERAKFEVEVERVTRRGMESVDQAAIGPDLGSILTDAMAALLPRFASRYWTGALAQMLLSALVRRVPDGRSLALAAAGGLEHNVTTTMNLRLWDAAKAIRSDPQSRNRFESESPESLAASYATGDLPQVGQTAVGAFLAGFGERGPEEIDLGRPNWSDDPSPVMQILRGLVALDDLELAPDRRFEEVRLSAEAAINELALAVRRRPLGGLQAVVVRWLAIRVRALVGIRETPKFCGVKLRGAIRARVLEEGTRLAAEGVLTQADDVFFLSAGELDRGPSNGSWRQLVKQRRDLARREERRTRLPRVLLSDGQAFYEQAPEPGDRGTDVLVGDAISPGVHEGTIRILHDPSEQLLPGEILVCESTNPAWTPHFLVAGALVMEVGGLMTHGSVVAREFGVPGVVGVVAATGRLQDGQRARVDGNRGEVVLLE